MNRNDFFRKGGRLTILTGIGILSAFLAYDQKIETPENCTVAPQCKGCGKLSQCTLPQADKIRQDGK
jgi:hypothetical protein